VYFQAKACWLPYQQTNIPIRQHCTTYTIILINLGQKTILIRLAMVKISQYAFHVRQRVSTEHRCHSHLSVAMREGWPFG
jgi:hypothetical protein